MEKMKKKPEMIIEPGECEKEMCMMKNIHNMEDIHNIKAEHDKKDVHNMKNICNMKDNHHMESMHNLEDIHIENQFFGAKNVINSQKNECITQDQNNLCRKNCEKNTLNNNVSKQKINKLFIDKINQALLAIKSLTTKNQKDLCSVITSYVISKRNLLLRFNQRFISIFTNNIFIYGGTSIRNITV